MTAIDICFFIAVVVGRNVVIFALFFALLFFIDLIRDLRPRVIIATVGIAVFVFFSATVGEIAVGLW